MSDTPDTSAQERRAARRARRDRISGFGLILSSAFIIALLVWLNAYPQWVGVIASGDNPATFIPVMGQTFRQVLPWINVALGLSLALNLLLLGQGRWTLATRWADMGLSALNCYVLWLLATSSPLLDETSQSTAAGQTLLKIGPVSVSALNSGLEILFWAAFGISVLVAAVKLVAVLVRTVRA